MGKAARWLKGLLGSRKEKDKDREKGKEQNYKGESSNSVNGDSKDKKRWSFSGKPGRDRKVSSQIPPHMPGSIEVPASAWLRSYLADSEKEQNKHAIAVAAATAAAADAAVAAAQAAVAVVRLTNNGRGTLFGGGKERWAAVKIQTVFRGYLARKALRALKGLVKLQALVRGYLVRKRTTATLHSMQALIRAQATVRSQRIRRSLNKDSRFHPDLWLPRRSTERCDDPRSEIHSKRLSTSIDMNNSYDDNSPKIVEIDTYKPRSRSRRMNVALSECGDEILYHGISSPMPCTLPPAISIPRHEKSGSVHDFRWCFVGDEYKFPTAQSTPRLVHSIKSFAAPPTPAKSVCGDSYFRSYSNFNPNYMAKTQSFKAKLRSQSAPKQRAELTSKKRFSLNDMMAARNSISSVGMHHTNCSHPQDASHF